MNNADTIDHNEQNNYYGQRLSDSDFKRLSQYISSHFGIKMPYGKKIMLEGRLQKRLKALNMTSFEYYCDYFFSDEGQNTEVVDMINMVSTNKTNFFRENAHFQYLQNEILPGIIKLNTQKPLKIWSSACSTGEENYSISMIISDFNQTDRINDYMVLGTDISTSVLDTATRAIYTEERVSDVPLDFKKSYLLRSKAKDNKVRIIPEIRARNIFRQLNLMGSAYHEIPRDFDIIFCRNVLIYFDRPTQENIVQKLCLHLRDGGYFFLGHSESISGMDVPLKQIEPTIFHKI